MVYPDHDEGPDRGTQDHHPRKIGQACRACRLQVPGGELLSELLMPSTWADINAGYRRASLSESELACR